MGLFSKKEPQAPPPDPAYILAEAQEYLKEKDFKGALEKFDELCALPVQSPLPLLSRATCRLQLSQYEGVLEDCNKVLKFLNSDLTGHEEEGCTTVHSLALLRMAKAYKELGRLDEAKSALMRRNVVEHKLGRTTNDEGEDENVEEKQKAAEEWKEKGNKEFKNENWSAALDCYRNGLSYDMYSVKLHSNACMALINLKRWAQALKHAEQCIALEPNWVKGYYMKGRILSNESKLEQAQQVLQKAAQMEPRNKQIKGLLEEVNSRVEYVESRLRRRKPKEQQEKTAEDSGTEQAVEDVDSDEDYCQDGTCSPKTVKVRVTRKDIMNIIVDLCAAMVGVAMVWWFVRQEA
ncbi:hypothetical protein LPJ78_002167 [Coemansia sp. RSA 989]|nr:hypothetical protein LPJ68_001495 [Coemansia sp. RSA 1086]KAJ1866071.1 hypothetical protein LPJ78_002167 [Coemansia sp. RSA 989]KAJ2631402.1 hypothetical protein H4R22_002010 [Coemansia sp. RSA 1290]